MSAVKRKIGINLTAGIAIAIIVFAAIFASGIYLPKATGTVVVSIKDAPVELEELWITVNSIQIQKSEDESWIDLTLDQAPATSTPQPTQAPSLADQYFVPGIIGVIVAIAVVGAVLALLVTKKP